MYELLKRAQGQEDWSLKVSGDDPQTPLVKRLVDLEMFETVTAMYGGRVVKLTAVGRAAVAQADAAGRQAVDPSPQESTVTFHQTNYGTANTQVGDRNVMNVQQGDFDQQRLVAQLAELRALIYTLPEAEQDEARSALEQTEKAVKGGNLEKVKNYGAIILGLGVQTLEFAQKAKDFFDGLGS